MKFVALTKNQKAIVDEDDYDRVVTVGKWYCDNNGYAVRRKPINVYMHRFIINAKKGDTVDHINRNPLDNRKENLRFCSRIENFMNSTKFKNNTTGLKGVAFHKHRKMFMASIGLNKIKKHLGYFDCKFCAGMEYDKAAKKFHGECAYLNNVICKEHKL